MTAGWLTALPLLTIALSGVVVLYRDHGINRRKRDLFHALNAPRAEHAVGTGGWDAGLRLRRLLRTVLGWRILVVGDEVETRSFAEIRATLDDGDCLEGLPFMPEMLPLCGQRARVFRRVDKIYDYGGRKVVRRLTNTVLLHQMRCNGSAHGGCQAGCYIMWKEAWLKPVAARTITAGGPITPSAPQPLKTPAATGDNGTAIYSCQFTRLVAASTPLASWDPRQDLRPLASGNVTAGAALVALLTRLFNYVQIKRGGVVFPPMLTDRPRNAAAAEPSVVAGDRVQVRPAEEILATLDKNSRHRGLRFDRDMLKHCEHDHEVLARIDHIIDDATGRMRSMKTPCIVLKGVTYSGEYLRFCPQEEYLYWRQAWLSPKAGGASAAGPATAIGA